ncbi:hypothetical protein MOD31_13035 [Paenarthrobacter sp. TYUT067]|uniref:hypothetical protein n=1 Tax=Paenarthrobacter sp. TYUT067 TaxID=2926245 RepID=UPI00202DD3BA|nr:hypothetical protein [Paenarthrobacter sp. TYUT067]MCM0616955.1 hypothetical protein [Paenarthrobacter sp. TYUT067]
MSSKEKSTVDRLTAADPASAVTEEELARSREKSLAAMDTDAEHITVGGSVTDFHQQPAGRRARLAAGFGLVAAAAAVVAGVVVTSSMTAPHTEQAAPAATQLDPAPETGSSSGLPLPEITGSPTPTVEADIVAGGAGKLAASTTEIDGVISGGIYMRPDVLRILKLEADNNGCIGNGFLFPTGTKVTDGGLVMPDGTVFSTGDVISFGGLEVNSKDVGACADGRPLVYMEEVRAYPGKVPNAGG